MLDLYGYMNYEYNVHRHMPTMDVVYKPGVSRADTASLTDMEACWRRETWLPWTSSVAHHPAIVEGAKTLLRNVWLKFSVWMLNNIKSEDRDAIMLKHLIGVGTGSMYDEAAVQTSADPEVMVPISAYPLPTPIDMLPPPLDTPVAHAAPCCACARTDWSAVNRPIKVKCAAGHSLVCHRTCVYRHLSLHLWNTHLLHTVDGVQCERSMAELAAMARVNASVY
jgi:hypothetical protein